MTLTRLAQMANTSVATVSKAFSGSREISEETKERIFSLAKELGCFDKYYKAPRSRPLIALMPPEPESEYYGREIGLIERALSQKGADTIIAFTRFDREQEARLFRELAYGMKVDGIILWGQGTKIKNPDELPLVVISSSKQLPSNSDVVRIDLESAILNLTSIIKDYGHIEVGFIGERLTMGKEQKFKSALRRTGLPVHNKYIAVSTARFADAGEDCMKQLIDRNAVPSVIVAAYDQIAYGAMKYAREHGYKIPEDVSFIGMDDISSAPYLDTSLSSLHTDFESVCPQIVDLIFRRMENRHYKGRVEISVPVKVNIRESLKRL